MMSPWFRANELSNSSFRGAKKFRFLGKPSLVIFGNPGDARLVRRKDYAPLG
jgi:hypothetical protein